MKRRLFNLFTALAVSATMLAAFAVPFVSAATQGQCNVGDTSKIRLWENSINDGLDGNDTLWLCGTSYPNLANISHTVAGNCNSGILGGGFDWNDCTDGATPFVPDGYYWCLYGSANYVDLRVVYTQDTPATHVNFPTGSKNVMSSLRLVTVATGC